MSVSAMSDLLAEHRLLLVSRRTGPCGKLANKPGFVLWIARNMPESSQKKPVVAQRHAGAQSFIPDVTGARVAILGIGRRDIDTAPGRQDPGRDSSPSSGCMQLLALRRAFQCRR